MYKKKERLKSKIKFMKKKIKIRDLKLNFQTSKENENWMKNKKKAQQRAINMFQQQRECFQLKLKK
jgi:hypothetical protein